ncbi:MAG: DUF2934 domain-containing protein [Polyangia bacterium]
MQQPHGSSPAPAARHIDVRTASDADIAKLAYAKYEARGRAHGLDKQDWAAARHELIG